MTWRATAGGTSSKVFYYKMKGDYYRYLAEFLEQNERSTVAGQANEAYDQATKIACSDKPEKVGPDGHFSPCHRMEFDSRSGDTKCVLMTRRAMPVRP